MPLYLKKFLNISYTAVIENNQWLAIAQIPESYFPLNVTGFNAYNHEGDSSYRTVSVLANANIK